MDDYMKSNRDLWDELTHLFMKLAESYDVEGFTSGRSTLKPIEVRELGDVAGSHYFIYSVILVWILCHGQIRRPGNRCYYSPKAIDLAR